MLLLPRSKRIFDMERNLRNIEQCLFADLNPKWRNILKVQYFEYLQCYQRLLTHVIGENWHTAYNYPNERGDRSAVRLACMPVLR
jgi:hypothetical protein